MLDVNVLLALLDPAHVFHDRTHAWFKHTSSGAWATCPLTENGVVRIASQPSYPNSPGTPPVVTAMLQEFCAHPGHVFWADTISVRDGQRFAHRALLRASQLTDSYLLALAVAHKGFLATLDRQLASDAVIGGKAALHIIK